MTWSYNLSIISSSPKDQVRLQVGDTNSSAPLLQDEEIGYFLTQRPTIYGAAAECCRSLAARYSSQATMAAGDSKIMYSDLAKAYASRAIMFETQSTMSGAAVPYAGGISIADKLNNEQNLDRVEPQFNIGMDEDLLPVSPAGNESSISPGGEGT